MAAGCRRYKETGCLASNGIFQRIRIAYGGRLPPLQEDAMLMPQKVISYIYTSLMAALKAAATVV